MRVSWSEKAAKAASQTSVYILTEFGSRANRKFLKEIERTSLLLEDNPLMGQIEPLLVDKPKQYRSIVVNRLNKNVYYIHGDIIRIAAFWDTRREPKPQADELE